jgi:hypothetical protein
VHFFWHLSGETKVQRVVARQVGIGVVGIEFSRHLFIVTTANLDAFEFDDLVVNLALGWSLLGVD